MYALILQKTHLEISGEKPTLCCNMHLLLWLPVFVSGPILGKHSAPQIPSWHSCCLKPGVLSCATVCCVVISTNSFCYHWWTFCISYFYTIPYKWSIFHFCRFYSIAKCLMLCRPVSGDSISICQCYLSKLLLVIICIVFLFYNYVF